MKKFGPRRNPGSFFGKTVAFGSLLLYTVGGAAPQRLCRPSESEGGYYLWNLPSVICKGGVAMASFQDVILLLDLIVNTITLVVLIYGQKK